MHMRFVLLRWEINPPEPSFLASLVTSLSPCLLFFLWLFVLAHGLALGLLSGSCQVCTVLAHSLVCFPSVPQVVAEWIAVVALSTVYHPDSLRQLMPDLWF